MLIASKLGNSFRARARARGRTRKYQSNGKYMNILLIIFLMLAPFFAHSEQPWGKDADLCYPKEKEEERVCSTPLLGPLAETLIGFHRNVVSPADGPRSHYVPSSSKYTLIAMQKYGFFYGFLLGCDRLMRENSDQWIYPTVIGPQGRSLFWNPVK